MVGFCADCGVPGVNEVGDATRRSKLPSRSEVGEGEAPCPATLGSGHRFGENGACVSCGFSKQIIATAEPSD